MFLKRELAFFAIIIIFGLTVSLFVFNMGHSNLLNLTVRLSALNGYIALSIAAIMTPFLKEITLFFKKSFVKVHHYFAAAGLLLITLHPIAVFIQTSDLTVFLPNFNSIYFFFFFGGTIALVLIYVAFGAVLIRRKIVAYWRPFHMLMYLALFIGVVHANLRGTDFQNIYLAIIYDALFAAALAAFVLKRWQFYRIKMRVKKIKLTTHLNTKA
jgi:DMSO/TMAO reductase YedYZ heme-binding membrane subunit